MSRICYGCGSKLQYADKEKNGYVRKEKINDAKYCERCFKMIHYGENIKNKEPKTIDEIIKTLNKNAKFVVFMSSFIDISYDIVNIYKKIKVPKILVISKSDIIPKNISFEEIKKYIRVNYGIKEDIVFTSYNSSLNSFIKKISEYDEIYFVGMTSSGKSTLINKINEKLGSKNVKLTTSYKENTTEDFVRLKIGNMTIIDSPGFLIENFEVGKNENIFEEIKPMTYQNKLPCTFKIGNLFKIRIDGKSSVVFYFSKNINLERLYNNKVIGTTFRVGKDSDIIITGLGFIKTTEDITITVPSDIVKYINIRPSITGGKNLK